MITAIETKYKGYRFRSRLEARWAVFFDTLGIAWEYEKEGYDLGKAGWYLPDFWLPDLQLWIEIKGENPTPQEKAKAQQLCAETKCSVGILSGTPWFNIFRAYYFWRPAYTQEEIEAYGFEGDDLSDGESAIECSYWFNDNDGTYNYEKEDGRGCYYQGWLTWGLDENNKPNIVTLVERDDVRAAHAISYAYYAARSARFEHGESGT